MKLLVSACACGFCLSAYFFVQLPSVDEISAHMAGTKLTTIIFFLDETFEEVSWLGRPSRRPAL